MASSLFTAVLNDRTRAPHFFNGRLLTGEAMTDEQRANRVARELLAQAVGAGVAYGLEVSEATRATTSERPVVTVKSGVAINRRGEILLLAQDTDVQLVKPDEEAAASGKIFQACTPVSTGTYIADAGVYLLTISTIRAGNGLAAVSGLGEAPAGCNIKYIVDAVEFRLMELPISEATLADTDRLRNRVAYECFGVGHVDDFAKDPFATPSGAQTPLDDLRDDEKLTDCDVPLAVFYWTASGGLQWIDLWAVRRRITRTNVAANLAAVGDPRLATAEAMVLQFQDQIEALRQPGTSLSLAAAALFAFLPPVGLLPAAASGKAGFVHSLFFQDLTILGPRFTEGAKLSELVADALRHPPIRLADLELIRLYNIRENRSALDAGSDVTAAIVFTNGHVGDRADARFDLAHWSYASYS